IGCTKNSNRTERDMAETHIRSWQRSSVRNGGIDPYTQKATVADDISKEAHLADGSVAFAEDAASWKAALDDATLDQFVAKADNVVGNRFEEKRALFEIHFAIGIKRRCRHRASFGNIGFSCACKWRLDCFTALCIDCMEQRSGAAA